MNPADRASSSSGNNIQEQRSSSKDPAIDDPSVPATNAGIYKRVTTDTPKGTILVDNVLKHDADNASFALGFRFALLLTPKCS